MAAQQQDNYGQVAQWQELRTVNPAPNGFVGSSPTLPTIRR